MFVKEWQRKSLNQQGSYEETRKIAKHTDQESIQSLVLCDLHNATQDRLNLESATLSLL